MLPVCESNFSFMVFVSVPFLHYRLGKSSEVRTIRLAMHPSEFTIWISPSALSRRTVSTRRQRAGLRVFVGLSLKNGYTVMEINSHTSSRSNTHTDSHAQTNNKLFIFFLYFFLQSTL